MAIRIDDLAQPRFDEATLLRRQMAVQLSRPLELRSDVLMERASTLVGLSDFGRPDFREPLEVLLRSLRQDAPLSPFGVVGLGGQVVQLLANRLVVENLLRRHPEIEDLAVERPLIVTGLPRSGTTYLHNLLAGYGELRYLPYWESLDPLGQNSIERCQAGLQILQSALPALSRLYPMTATSPAEEINLVALNFSGGLFETWAPLPTWREYYLASDQRPHYAYLKTVLKVLQFLRGGRRWLLKAPQHLEFLPDLISVFPDATVIFVHRQPGAVVASLATLLTYLGRVHLDPVDPKVIGKYALDLVVSLARRGTATREVVAAENSLDIRFEDLCAAPQQCMAEIQRAAQLAPQAVGPVEGRGTGMEYDLGEFGLSERDLEGLRGYCHRFLDIPPSARSAGRAG